MQAQAIVLLQDAQGEVLQDGILVGGQAPVAADLQYSLVFSSKDQAKLQMTSP